MIGELMVLMQSTNVPSDKGMCPPPGAPDSYDNNQFFVGCSQRRDKGRSPTSVSHQVCPFGQIHFWSGKTGQTKG
jgi:hypothetical protein